MDAPTRLGETSAARDKQEATPAAKKVVTENGSESTVMPAPELTDEDRRRDAELALEREKKELEAVGAVGLDKPLIGPSSEHNCFFVVWHQVHP